MKNINEYDIDPHLIPKPQTRWDKIERIADVILSLAAWGFIFWWLYETISNGESILEAIRQIMG